MLNMGTASLSNKLKSFTAFKCKDRCLINFSIFWGVESRKEVFVSSFQVPKVKCYNKVRKELQTVAHLSLLITW